MQDFFGKGGHLPNMLSLAKTLKIMTVNIQISDAVYASLLNGTKRIQGTLALVNPTEGNFNEHRKTWRQKPGTKYMRLPHGRVTVTDEDVRMRISINVDEAGIIPSQIILDESEQASDFVDANFIY